MYWYVLFVQAGREDRVSQFLKKRLDSCIFTPFIPLHERLFKISSGTVKREVKPLFPGYVFVESALSSHEFIKRSSSIIHTSNLIIKLLRYSETEFAMREDERQMLLSLYNDDHCIESSIGIIEGDKIRIIDGPLSGKESIVRKVNRHKRQAWIEIEFMGDLKQISIALEIIERLK